MSNARMDPTVRQVNQIKNILSTGTRTVKVRAADLDTLILANRAISEGRGITERQAAVLKRLKSLRAP